MTALLETRSLNFDHVIILDVNEGALPRLRVHEPLIPREVMISLNLDRLELEEVLTDAVDHRGERGHDAADDASRELAGGDAVMGQKVQADRGVLVALATDVGAHTPRGLERFAIEDASGTWISSRMMSAPISAGAKASQMSEPLEVTSL